MPLVMFWLWPQAKKPWLFGFGTKAKAGPTFWPGLAFGPACDFQSQSQAKKPWLSVVILGHFLSPLSEFISICVRRVAPKNQVIHGSATSSI